MTHRALMIRHMKREDGDRVSEGLRERGFELDYVCPAEGERLPEINGAWDRVVVYGGIQSANDPHDYIRAEIDWIGRWVRGGRPYLGLCLGGQLLARSLGATVAAHPLGHHEIGYVRITPAGTDSRFLPAPLFVYHWHGEGFGLAPEAQLLARGETFCNQAFRVGSRAYGLQFHPETTPEIFQRWIREAGHHLERPGAHGREQQLADAAVHDEPMRRWLQGFLDAWLAD